MDEKKSNNDNNMRTTKLQRFRHKKLMKLIHMFHTAISSPGLCFNREMIDWLKTAFENAFFITRKKEQNMYEFFGRSQGQTGGV